MVERNTHLIAWLEDGYTSCQHGSKEWAEGYLHNARDVIVDQDARIAQLERENASLLETVTRKVNEKIEAERDLAEARNHVAELELERARFVAELDAATLERDANHNLAVANGLRAKEEDQRAEAAEAERDRLAAAIEAAASEAETKAQDLRNDDATRRGAAYAAHLIRVARASLQTGEKGE